MNGVYKTNISFNAFRVWCVTLVPYALLCDWSGCTLATSAVAEWFNLVVVTTTLHYHIQGIIGCRVVVRCIDIDVSF